MSSLKPVIAVTGATGFVGRAFVSLMQDKRYLLRALTRQPRQSGTAEWIEGTLEDEAAVEKLAEGAMVFIHIAGLTKARSLNHLLIVNETGARRAARAARKAGAKRFILVSSIAAREPHLSDYAQSKRAGETAVLEEAGNMEVLIVRPPAIIGPGDPATAPMLNIFKLGWLPAPSGRARKQGRMSFVYMEDIAQVLVQCIDKPMSDQVITPHGKTRQTSWQELADTASDVLSKPVRLIPIPPLILMAAAFITQTVCAIFRRSSFFNTGKVRELLHNDWTGDYEIEHARSLHDALELAFGMDAHV